MTISLSNIIAIFGTMVVLAAIPSVSVLTVTARAAAYGFLHGVITSLGIIAADILFILVVIYGLSHIANAQENLFSMLQCVGAVYLCWMGVVLWRSVPVSRQLERAKGSSLMSSFKIGFLITLGDQKAILFYLGFLPAFLDLSRVNMIDTMMIILIMMVAIAVGKLGYVYFADRLGARVSTTKLSRGINILAGSIMLAVGIFIMSKLLGEIFF